MQARYFDPEREITVEVRIPDAGIEALIVDVLSLRSGRGHPALELLREDGSSLAIGTDGTFAVLEWTNSLGENFQSVGSDAGAPTLVYDYYGSWSEAPGEAQVPLSAAMTCAERFIDLGTPDTPEVLFVGI